MKHISKVNVYGKRNLSKKEINRNNKENNNNIYCDKHKRKFTPQENVNQFAKVYYIDKKSFELVNNRSESYEIIHWYYNINESNNEETQQGECYKEISLPQKNVKMNEFEIKLIKSRKLRKNEVINVKYKYLYKDINEANKDKNINNLKTIKPNNEENDLKINLNNNDNNSCKNNCKHNNNDKDDKNHKYEYKKESSDMNQKGNEKTKLLKDEVILNQNETNKENNCNSNKQQVSFKNNIKKDKQQLQIYQNEILHISACNNKQNKLQQLNEKMFYKDIDLNMKTIMKKDILNTNNKEKKIISKHAIKSKKHHNKKHNKTKNIHSLSTCTFPNNNNNCNHKELKIKESKHNCPCHRILDPSMYYQNSYPKNISIKLDYYPNRNHSQNQIYQVAVKIPNNLMKSLNHNFNKSSPNFSKSFEK